MNLQGKDVKIVSGKYAGLVGSVEEVKTNGMARVKVAGVLNNEPLDVTVWLRKKQLEGGQHG